MKIIVRVDLITDWGDVSTSKVGKIDRPCQELAAKTVGLLMENGKCFLPSLQQAGCDHRHRHLASRTGQINPTKCNAMQS
jgi:hypothetical protein